MCAGGLALRKSLRRRAAVRHLEEGRRFEHVHWGRDFRLDERLLKSGGLAFALVFFNLRETYGILFIGLR